MQEAANNNEASKNIEVLLVEDNKAMQDAFGDAVYDFNGADHGAVFSVEYVVNLDEAEKRIRCSHFDAIIVDLQLEGDQGTQEHSGNKVLQVLLEGHGQRSIIFIYSGTMGSLDEDIRKKIECSPLFKALDRATDSNEVLEQIFSLWGTGVTQVLGRRGMLEDYINRIFFDHIAPGFQAWASTDPADKKSFLRYTALHLLEYLDMSDDGAGGEIYGPHEFYIYPPIRQPVATGDVVKWNDETYALMSPSCDVAVRGNDENGTPEMNVETVVLLQVLPFDKEKFESKGGRYSAKGKNNTEWKKFAENARKNSKQRFHFLPGCMEVKEGLIDFKRPCSIPASDYFDPQKVKRIATISSPFARDIQARFSAYYGRQGQPEGSWKNGK